jgi:Tfp pilus assembly protein PilN
VSALMRSISASQWLKDPELEVVQTKSDTAGSSFVLDAQQITLTDAADADGTKRPLRTVGGAK